MENLPKLLTLAFSICVALVAMLIGAGSIYQYASEAADMKRYSPPGRLIDVGGRKLHILCAGTSAGPTVVIEAGSGDDSTAWEDMVRRVSAFARVCTYDRARLGWSDPAPGARTIDDRAADLKALLSTAEVPAPYVLVGHSYGGYIVRRFAAAYPASVQAVVLIDAPDEEFSFAPDGIRFSEQVATQEQRRGWLTQVGLARIANALFPDRFDPARGVPPDIRGLKTALALRTARHFVRADEMASYFKVPRAWQAFRGFGVLGGTPLVVISRGPQDPGSGKVTNPAWREAQERLTQLSTGSMHIIAERSGHEIQSSEPNVISDAIRQVLAELAKQENG